MNNNNLMRQNDNTNLLLYDLSNIIKDNYVFIKNNVNNIKKTSLNIMNNNIKISILNNLHLIEMSTEQFMEKVKLIFKKYDTNNSCFQLSRNSSADMNMRKNKNQKFQLYNLNNSICFINPSINKKLLLQKKNSNNSDDFYNDKNKIKINTVNCLNQINKLKEENKNLLVKIGDKEKIIQNLFQLKEKYYKEIVTLKNNQNNTYNSNFKSKIEKENSSQLVENLKNEINNKNNEITILSQKVTNFNSINNKDNCNDTSNVSNNDLNLLLSTLKTEIEKFKNFSNISISQNIINNNVDQIKNLSISNTIKFSLKKKKRKKSHKGKRNTKINNSINSLDISSSSNKMCLKTKKLSRSFSKRESKCGIEKLNKNFKKIINQQNKNLNIGDLEFSNIFEKDVVELNESCFKELKIMNSQDVNVNGDKLLKDEDFLKTYNSVEEELEANKKQLVFLKNDIKEILKKIDLIKENAKNYFSQIYVTKKSRDAAKKLLKSMDYNDNEINIILEPKKTGS